MSCAATVSQARRRRLPEALGLDVGRGAGATGGATGGTSQRPPARGGAALDGQGYLARQERQRKKQADIEGQVRRAQLQQRAASSEVAVVEAEKVGNRLAL